MACTGGNKMKKIVLFITVSVIMLMAFTTNGIYPIASSCGGKR
jgi:hypothetical protein